jgi:hypothetical protein
VEAIKPDTEAGAEKWLKLNADYAKTRPNITVKRDPLVRQRCHLLADGGSLALKTLGHLARQLQKNSFWNA